MVRRQTETHRDNRGETHMSRHLMAERKEQEHRKHGHGERKQRRKVEIDGEASPGSDHVP